MRECLKESYLLTRSIFSRENNENIFLKGLILMANMNKEVGFCQYWLECYPGKED